MRGRAIFLLYQLGPEGRKRAGAPESFTDPALRIAAYRAMRRAGLDVMPVAARLARDADPGVRREVALSMRDQPAGRGPRHPGRRRPRLRRPGSHLPRSAGHRRHREGSGALRSAAGTSSASGDPMAWSPAFARIAWRLHVPAAVADLTARAQSAKLPAADRRLAVDTLAFVKDPAASKAMLDARAGRRARCASTATWWLLNRMSNDWAELRTAAGAQGGRHLRPRRRSPCVKSVDARSPRPICRSSRSTRSSS